MTCKDFLWRVPIISLTALLLSSYSSAQDHLCPCCSLMFQAHLPSSVAFSLGLLSAMTLFFQLTHSYPSNLGRNFVFSVLLWPPYLIMATAFSSALDGLVPLALFWISSPITQYHLSIIWIVWIPLPEGKLHEDRYLCFIDSFTRSPWSSAWHKEDMESIFVEPVNECPKQEILSLPINLTWSSAYSFV